MDNETLINNPIQPNPKNEIAGATIFTMIEQMVFY
jgi:hypothetical protein